MQSLCEHHMLPPVGVAHVGYLPGERILGRPPSRARWSTTFVTPRPAARLTQRVADHLRIVWPRRAWASWTRPSTLQRLRGPPGSRTVTSALVRLAARRPATRAEFLALTWTRSTT